MRHHNLDSIETRLFGTHAPRARELIMLLKLAPPSARMPSPPKSAKAGWVKSTEPETPSSTGTGRSVGCVEDGVGMSITLC